MSTRSLRSSVTGQTLRRDGPHHPDVPGIVGNCDTADGGALCVGINSNEAWLEFYEFDSIPEIGADPRWDSYDKRSPTTNFEHAERSGSCDRTSPGRCAAAQRLSGNGSSTRTGTTSWLGRYQSVLHRPPQGIYEVARRARRAASYHRADGRLRCTSGTCD